MCSEKKISTTVFSLKDNHLTRRSSSEGIMVAYLGIFLFQRLIPQVFPLHRNVAPGHWQLLAFISSLSFCIPLRWITMLASRTFRKRLHRRRYRSAAAKIPILRMRSRPRAKLLCVMEIFAVLFSLHSFVLVQCCTWSNRGLQCVIASQAKLV